MKRKLLKCIVYSINVLFLFSTFQFVRANQNNADCSSVNTGGVCNNSGHIYDCTGICNIGVSSVDSEASSSTSVFQNPKPTVVDTGNFKFKLLGCKSSKDRVQCDLIVVNGTSLDRTIFVGYQQHVGIPNISLNSFGKTTLIDSNGLSYVASSVLFTKNNRGETGQSLFRIYAKTTPKLSVIFTRVKTPATIERLNLVVGEYIKSKNAVSINTIKYLVSAPVLPD